MRIYTRQEWGALPPRPGLTMGNNPKEAFIHHSADIDARFVDDFKSQAQTMRITQAFHMNTRGWLDIAYHYVVFQPYGTLATARAFEGRSTHAVPAAQLNHNTDTLAICVYGDFTPGHDQVKRNTRYVIEELLDRIPGIHTVGGHRDVVATTCPGDNLYREIPTIAKACGIHTYK